MQPRAFFTKPHPRDEQWAAFDALPKSLREFLSELPRPVDPVPAAEFMRRHPIAVGNPALGEHLIKRAIVATLEQYFARLPNSTAHLSPPDGMPRKEPQDTFRLY